MNSTDIKKLHNLVMDGLGLKYLPDVSKTNISQTEYTEKYNLYLSKVRQRNRREINSYINNNNNINNYNNHHDNNNVDDSDVELNANNYYDDDDDFDDKHLFTFTSNTTKNVNWFHNHHQRVKRSIDVNDIVFVRFPLPTDELSTDIDESILRLMINSHSHNNNLNNNNNNLNNIINIKVYQLIEPYGRVWLDTYKTIVGNLTDKKWIEFDVSKAVESWINGNRNLGIEIYCENCEKNGVHIIHDSSIHSNSEQGPTLNIIGKLSHREKRSKQHQHFLQNSRRKIRRTDCHKDNQKCCRHVMEVTFKEIKGFEFIIQPKMFDAGYCRGKCPPRYNPAHHHALLQSLIWKQDRNKAPRPCCAPSKLVELEVLHVDEEDPSKLKVSVWSDMRVLECACS